MGWPTIPHKIYSSFMATFERGHFDPGRDNPDSAMNVHVPCERKTFTIHVTRSVYAWFSHRDAYTGTMQEFENRLASCEDETERAEINTQIETIIMLFTLKGDGV